MRIRIVTDSTCDLKAETCARLGIAVVPLTINFEADVYQDSVTMSKDEFYERMGQSAVLPRTSQPSAGAFRDAYAALIAEEDLGADDVILSIHISAKLSGTTNAAQAGAGLLEAGAPRVEVVDSKSVTLGLGHAAVAACEAVEAGGDVVAARAAALSAAERTRILVVVDTLEYLQKGGRIGRARAFLGTLLRTKPLLELADGEVEGIERPRTRQKALDRLCDQILRTPRPLSIDILQATTPDEAEQLAERLRRERPEIAIGVVQVSPVIGVHTGPGAMGAAILRAPA